METTSPVIHKPYEIVDDEPGWVSEQDYWDHYYINSDHRYEWNDGKLEKKGMADFLSIQMYQWFMLLLGEYLKENPVGRMMALEMGFRITVGPRVTIRKPDLAIILHSNPVKAELLDRSYRGTCDICIEFLSDSTQSDVDRDTIIKKAEYENSGVLEYYVLDRLHHHTAFYEQQVGQGGTVYQVMDQASGIVRSSVLPGFAFRIEHLKTLPLLETLVDDPIYQEYLLKFFQESKRSEEEALKGKEKALKEKDEATKAKEEAEQAKKDAEQAKEEALRAKEDALKAKEDALKAKEDALKKLEKEQAARDDALARETDALAKAERMAELLKQKGIDPEDFFKTL